MKRKSGMTGTCDPPKMTPTTDRGKCHPMNKSVTINIYTLHLQLMTWFKNHKIINY